MNPFDLAGPQFLIFYGALGLGVWGWIFLARVWTESGTVPKLDNVDPYLIAHLRGGASEAARVAIVALIDRGLLKERDGEVKATVRVKGLRSGLEQAIVDACKRRSEVKEIYSSLGVETACAEYEAKLTQLRLMPDDATEAARRGRLVVALLVLAGVSAIKVGVALSRGHSNVFFLILMTLVFGFLVTKESSLLQTSLGRRLLQDLRTLFARLKDRAGTLPPGGATAEVALLAGVFGVTALPGDRFPYIQRLLAKGKASRSWGSSCGSAWGSACGGGACGGGCGGCSS